jgi:predicted PurR-regulated permease PerM
LQNRRVPSGAAALICVLLFIAVVNVALAAIVVPASEWVTLLPQRLARIQSNIAPVLDLFKSLQHFVDSIVKRMASGPVARAATPAVAPPNSVLALLATSAPSVLIEMFYALLLVFFFLAGWTRLKRKTITSRTSIAGAVTTARVLRDVVSATSSYLATITMVNIILGLIVAAALWAIGLPSPLMWGGLVTILNYIPYLGPIFAAVLLTLGGLMSFTDIWWAFMPPAIMIGLHLVEANAITPMLVGRRVKINPLLILISISFWGWVWGPLGALLATPLLIIIQRVIAAAGVPDITGFLFEEGTLTHVGEHETAP